MLLHDSNLYVKHIGDESQYLEDDFSNEFVVEEVREDVEDHESHLAEPNSIHEAHSQDQFVSREYLVERCCLFY